MRLLRIPENGGSHNGTKNQAGHLHRCEHSEDTSREGIRADGAGGPPAIRG